MTDEVTKVYCTDGGCANNALAYTAMANANKGTSPTELAALMNNNSSQWNNPWIYMVWMMMFRNGLWGGNEGGENYNSRQLTALQNTVNDNHNNDLAMQAINGNTQAVRELATNLNVPLSAIQQGICGINAGLQNLGGQIGMSSQQVINSILLGNKDLQAQLMSCCCENKQLVQSMGYETQLRDQTNTCSIINRIGELANGVQQGFASIGYQNSQNTNAIIQAGAANTQRIVDVLNSHWQSDLQQKYQDAKLELSQLNQNATLIAALKTTA